MNRLTFLNNGKAAYRLGGTVYKNAIAERLAAYEDSGLSPKETLAAGVGFAPIRQLDNSHG